MAESSIGDRELKLLQHLAHVSDASVREAVDAFGGQHGLARSTVLTMMERLRVKGYLKRRRVKGVYRYSVATAPREATRRVVARFVERTLGGSVSPLVAWLAERGEVSDTELGELKALVAQLQSTRKEG